MKKYGRLTILREYKSRYPGGRPCRRFECLCDCGNTTNPTKEKVLKGETKSCGCLQEEVRKNLGKRNRKKFGQSAFNTVYSVYKKGAELRGYEFSLSESEFLEIITRPCIYCGDELTSERGRGGQYGSFKYTGIDRYDNNVGYTIENSVPCCSICNRIKTDMDIETLRDHLNKMMENGNMFKRTA